MKAYDKTGKPVDVEMQEESMKRRVLDELDLSGTPEEYEDCGYLTVNELPSGRKVVWYLDESLSLALDLATGEDVTSQAEAELTGEQKDPVY